MSRSYDRKNAGSRPVPEAKDQWYVLHVLSNKERRSVENLNRLFKEDEEMGALLQMDEQVFAAARHSLDALAPDEDTEVLWIRVLQLARQQDGD